MTLERMTMSDLTFEQRHRLETEVLPAVIGDSEYAAATIVRLEAERDRLREALDMQTAETEGCMKRVVELEALAGKEEK